jgi:hypothetical protein
VGQVSSFLPHHYWKETMSRYSKQLDLKRTPAEYVQAYREAVEKIEKAYRLLEDAKQTMKSIYGDTSAGRYDPLPRRNYRGALDCKDEVLEELKKRSWQSILDIMQVNKVASDKRWKEIQDRLESGKLPDITLEEIHRLYEQYVSNANELFAESLKEVADYLRPGRLSRSHYKTNADYEIGDKVILTNHINHGFNKVNYYYRKSLINLDRVFHILDGKLDRHLNNTYQSELVDTINENWQEGETEYFEYKGYKNGNLHLKIKRLDLVEEMVRILSEKNLKG